MALIDLLTDERLFHNKETGIWGFETRDDAATILLTADLWLMREWVDWLEATGRLPAPKHTSAT